MPNVWMLLCQIHALISLSNNKKRFCYNAKIVSFFLNLIVRRLSLENTTFVVFQTFY